MNDRKNIPFRHSNVIRLTVEELKKENRMDYLQLKRKVENKTEGVIEYKISGAIRSKL